MSVESEKIQKLMDIIIDQNNILNRVVESLDNIDRRVKKIELKID